MQVALAEFELLLREYWPDLAAEKLEKIKIFYGLVLEENEKQNLTRLLSPKDFVEGHVLDVRALLTSGLLSFPAMDLGSGVGVPGLLTGLIDGNEWVLVESERSKADFLSRAVQALKLKNIRVLADRGEAFLRANRVSSIVARAVGPVDRIYGWIRQCSTWNNLVLLKGPAWNEEWSKFSEGKHRRELVISKVYEYSVGTEKKSRIIVKIDRVPRGTH